MKNSEASGNIEIPLPSSGMIKLQFVRTMEDNNKPFNGLPYHRVQKLYKQEDGSHLVASSLTTMVVKEVALYATDESGSVNTGFFIKMIEGTNDINEALRMAGYEVIEEKK